MHLLLDILTTLLLHFNHPSAVKSPCPLLLTNDNKPTLKDLKAVNNRRSLLRPRMGPPHNLALLNRRAAARYKMPQPQWSLLNAPWTIYAWQAVRMARLQHHMADAVDAEVDGNTRRKQST